MFLIYIYTFNYIIIQCNFVEKYILCGKLFCIINYLDISLYKVDFAVLKNFFLRKTWSSNHKSHSSMLIVNVPHLYLNKLTPMPST